MKKDPYAGKFIVFEGIDGSGKATQVQLLVNRFEKDGLRVSKIDFPQHGTRSAALVDDYLNGKYGSAEEVGPYQASVFYACDRYDASFRMKQWLKEGRIIVSDRYVASSIGHQGGKIKDKEERRRFVKWIYNLEYEIFKIPRPDITFILKTSPELAYKIASRITDAEKRKKRASYLGNSDIRDIHEKDTSHLENALIAYLDMAKEFPEDFQVINCIKDGEFLPPEQIYNKILEIIKLKFFNI